MVKWAVNSPLCASSECLATTSTFDAYFSVEFPESRRVLLGWTVYFFVYSLSMAICGWLINHKLREMSWSKDLTLLKLQLQRNKALLRRSKSSQYELCGRDGPTAPRGPGSYEREELSGRNSKTLRDSEIEADLLLCWQRVYRVRQPRSALQVWWTYGSSHPAPIRPDMRSARSPCLSSTQRKAPGLHLRKVGLY